MVIHQLLKDEGAEAFDLELVSVGASGIAWQPTGTTAGTSMAFRVLLDGRCPRYHRGVDVDEPGAEVLTDQRLYQLIRQTGSIEDRLFEIEFADAGSRPTASPLDDLEAQ